MQNLSILNKKQIKEILAAIKKQWDCEPELDYVFMLSEKDRLFFAKREVFSVDTAKLRVNSIGLYVGEFRNGELRLSIEGSQIIGPFAKKNVFELKSSAEWLSGEDIDCDADVTGYVLIKRGNDFLGCGRYREGRMMNFVPKTRRLKTVIPVDED